MQAIIGGAEGSRFERPNGPLDPAGGRLLYAADVRF
jgi:hypothetical protein